MAQQAQVRLPPHLLPRLKAPATASPVEIQGLGNAATATVTAAASTSIPQASSRSRHGSPSNRKQALASDPSDKATCALVRRVLYTHSHHGATAAAAAGPVDGRQPIHDFLPPLTSSNEVDLQLYAIIAIVVREFIQSWYGKITPDGAFVDEVLAIIAHCTRALEQRARRLDIAGLLLDEIPELLIRHIDGEWMTEQ